jgi:uncharacterized protein (DUF58 family)
VTTAASLFDSAFLAKLEQLQLLARRLFRGERRAERRSRQIGSSLEFADYREYTPGDEPRSIDWNAFGRLDRLFVKLHEEEQDLPVHFLIDGSASMRWLPDDSEGREPALTKFDQARRLCAALAYIALANLDRVNVHFFAADLLGELGVARGRGQFHSVLKFLDAPPPADGPTRLRRAVEALVQRARHRGIVFVLSDFFDPAGYEDALGLLQHSQFDVHVVQILAPAELAPASTGDLRLEEPESGGSIEITANEHLLRRYAEEITAFNEALKSRCLVRGVAFARVTTDVPFEGVVLRMLRAGAMLR